MFGEKYVVIIVVAFIKITLQDQDALVLNFCHSVNSDTSPLGMPVAFELCTCAQTPQACEFFSHEKSFDFVTLCETVLMPTIPDEMKTFHDITCNCSMLQNLCSWVDTFNAHGFEGLPPVPDLHQHHLTF